ncbi:hypothetical protein AUR04nite_24490 [Glutamicibacter uratoxydans]|uniref:Uncharacterized protein n=1 Tax=Glutamicibacter uratoxydans TaxID=43667 RepID=A0A4Y4DQM8_GLUUR|nr:hypothetical protein AUR04nite_24490 [Glutamicibacter uratoxydans]
MAGKSCVHHNLAKVSSVTTVGISSRAENGGGHFVGCDALLQREPLSIEKDGPTRPEMNLVG